METRIRRVARDARRTELLGCRLTEAEREEIVAFAASREITVSELLRLLALTAARTAKA